MRFYASLISVAALLLTGCEGQRAVDYGFAIRSVAISRDYRSLNVHLQQDLQLSQRAREALEHGVALTIHLELELRNDDNMIAAQRHERRFQLRYLPLSERYQLSGQAAGLPQAFPRLRHLLAAVDATDVHLEVGSLPPGGYELRARVSLDESRLPMPMRLPAWFSAQWRHDSEWSVWPFEVSA